MKTIRLLVTSLLVALCAGFSSCGDDELEAVQPEIMFSDGDSFPLMDSISEIMNAMVLSIWEMKTISQA